MLILVVHNQSETRRRIRAFLEECGHQVVEAANGDDALGVIRSNSFEGTQIISAVVCCADMRRGSGIELLKNLKDHYMLRALRFILFNAKTTSEYDDMNLRLADVAKAYHEQGVHFCLWKSQRDNQKFINILGKGRQKKGPAR